MSNIVTFSDFSDEGIRVTPDDCYSVLDLIRFCCQYASGGERKAWKRIMADYPEVVAKCHDFKFSGAGQRKTPVTNRAGVLYIIGLLPGAIGRSYREDSAKVFLQYLDASPELAESVIDRAKPEDLVRIQRRLEGRKIRVSFTQVLQDHGVEEGWQFAECTNAMYRPILGGTAKQVRAVRGLSKKANLRDHMDTVELAATGLVESLSARSIKEQDLDGFVECRDECDRNARKVKRILDED